MRLKDLVDQPNASNAYMFGAVKRLVGESD